MGLIDGFAEGARAVERPEIPVRVLELFCGLGGFAAAVDVPSLRRSFQVERAVDVHPGALETYARNFPDHPLWTAEIAALDAARLRAPQADLWWMSPPCQPFTRRGLQRDLEDPRCRALLNLIRRIDEVRPTHLAMENVPDFETSDAARLLRETLRGAGYELREWMLCPSDMGVPNRRRRFYLLASLAGVLPEQPLPDRRFPLREILDPDAENDPDLRVPAKIREDYREALHVVDADDEEAQTACFTSAYGRSHVRSGSYLRLGADVRRFSPREIARLLGFPPDFKLPDESRRAWPLIGNSLSLFCVRHVLRHVRCV